MRFFLFLFLSQTPTTINAVDATIPDPSSIVSENEPRITDPSTRLPNKDM
jgi:hypothetical protein